jgi:PAS domain S-box-containing protein
VVPIREEGTLNRQEKTGSLSDEARYRILVEAIKDYAVFMLEPDGTVASWNSGAQRFKGYAAPEIIGRHFSVFYTPEDREAGLPQLALDAAATAGHFEAEGWRVRKDGSRFWTHVVIEPIRDPSGELIGFAKITRDLTERKRVEESLRRSEEQFRLLIQSVTDYAIYMLDTEGRVASWNAGAERIKGYSRDEIIGEHFSKFYPDEARERGDPQESLRIAAETGRYDKEGWRVRKDGTRFWASVVVDAIRDANGELLGFAKITRDTTEKREAQLALERTREALFQAQKMEAIGQVTGGIAHDFNNLLMVILSSLELMRPRLPDDRRLLKLVDNATQAAERGASLTKRMLAFARRQELDRKAVQLPELVRGMGDLLQRSLGPAFRTETRFPLSLPPVYTDPNQLETALLTLVVNARDAMPEGGVITIAAREEKIGEESAVNLHPGRYVCFSVEDQGEGMDEATLARAAEPFFTTKGVGKGTGLGLSMVQGFAEQGGGVLALRSRKGCGTTVEMWLPVAEARLPGRTGEVTAAAPPPGTAPELRVLVVDDDALVRMNTGAMLEDLGHSVIEAASGEEALSQLRSGTEADLVITDQAMPHMTGMQLAKAMRNVLPDLPIILASGYAEMEEGEHGDLPRLSKPFSRNELARAIRDVVGAGGGQIP